MRPELRTFDIESEERPVQTIVLSFLQSRVRQVSGTVSRVHFPRNIQEGCLSPTENASVSAISLRQKHILASLGTPLGQRGKCYMDGKRIQCWSNAAAYSHLSSTVCEL